MNDRSPLVPLLPLFMGGLFFACSSGTDSTPAPSSPGGSDSTSTAMIMAGSQATAGDAYVQTQPTPGTGPDPVAPGVSGTAGGMLSGTGGQSTESTAAPVTEAGQPLDSDTMTADLADAGEVDTTPDGGAAPESSAAMAAGSDGVISIEDPVPGFASEAGGTTGGGQDIGAAIVVRSMTELRAAAASPAPSIILVEPGDYDGELAPSANKTIVGLAKGVRISGNLKISGTDRHNIIVRNLAIQGKPCASYEACKQGADAVYVGGGAHHVWLDHLDVSDGQDGNCDITQGGDFVTVSWTHFHYTYDKEHRFSNLIAGSDNEPASVGKLHITYMNSHWGERVDQRQPRGRFGDIHMLNNYHHTQGSQIHGVGKDMALIAENSVYDEGISIWKDMGSPRGWRGIGNIGSGRDLNDSRGSVFEIPYTYAAIPASEVVAVVTSTNCGAGNTCEFKR